MPLSVLPRADADLALHNLLTLDRPLGHGIWIHDSSKTTNIERSLEIPVVSPRPAGAFELAAFEEAPCYRELVESERLAP